MIKLFEHIGSKIKIANPWINGFSVNCFQLFDGRVVNLIGYEKTDASIDDSKGLRFYIRTKTPFEYTPIRQLTSSRKEYRVTVRFRFLFYSVDQDLDLDLLKLENIFATNFRDMNFSDYFGAERQPEIVIKNTSVDTTTLYLEETKKEFRSGADIKLVAVDCELRFLSSDDNCEADCGTSTTTNILQSFDFCDPAVLASLCRKQVECLREEFGGAGGWAWGGIIGNIDDQTDLKEKFDQLQENIDQKISCDELADCPVIENLQSEIDEVADDFAQEISDRTTADVALQNNINDEASARLAADTVLQTNIENETVNRLNADNDLQDQIDDEITARENADIATLAASNAYTDSKVAGSFVYRGTWDGSGGLYPAGGGTGAGGAVQKGNAWEILSDCVINGESYDAGDLIVAKIDAPGQLVANWADSEHNTQQATESARGTTKIVTQAVIEDNTTANDSETVTAKKFWLGIAKALTRTNFFNAVLGTLLTGLSTATGTAVLSTDTILIAIGKLQKQITDLTAIIAAHIANTANPHNVTKGQVGLGNVTNDAQLKAADFDTDGTMAANSDAKIASQKATKTYADTKVGHSLATAVNDFLIASGAGVFVKKTLAETKTILGISNVANVDTTKGSIDFTFDGQGGVIAVGAVAEAAANCNGTITGIEIKEVSDVPVAANIVVDIWRDTYANYPPTVADTITAAAKPILAGAIKNQDFVLTGWTKNFTTGDIFKAKIDSSTLGLKVKLKIYYTRT